MARVLPLTVLAWEGPQARAYLVRLRRAGLRPERIILLVEDPIRARAGWSPGLHNPVFARWAERRQDRTRNFHPYAIRKDHPALVAAIGRAMADVVDDPVGQYHEMYGGFSYDDHADVVTRVPAGSYKDETVVEALREHGATTVLFTGGGIVPAAVFEVPGVRLIHVHTGFLPHVRGADVLLWSLLERGRPGVSAFFMTPGLDDGDVLAARELDPLAVPLPPGERIDDDTLYRALFSFIDPLIRAELLVADVLEPAADIDELAATPQDLDVGITYHFMHPTVRARALRLLFPSRPVQAGAEQVAAKGPSPADYQRYYEKPSVLAPLRFSFDTLRAGSPLRSRSIQNRQRDYGALLKDPRRLALHSELNRQLALQTEHWGTYDYGEGYFYQSSDELGITGLRDTTGRVEAFGLRDLVRGRSVFEIGCNTGFLTLAIARDAERIAAFELNPYLIAMAEVGAEYLDIDNVAFSVAAFEDFASDERFDDVLSFANHHTYDGNTQQPLEEYFERCHDFTKPGGRLIFESHPAELEGRGLRQDRRHHRAVLRHHQERGARLRHLPRQGPPLHHRHEALTRPHPVRQGAGRRSTVGPMGPRTHDVAIIGGGVVGCAIAHELSRHDVDAVLVERETEVGFGTSKANSGIIHGGHHAGPETLKGRLEWAGNQMWGDLCAELGFGFARVGELTVALERGRAPGHRPAPGQRRGQGRAGRRALEPGPGAGC